MVRFVEQHELPSPPSPMPEPRAFRMTRSNLSGWSSSTSLLVHMVIRSWTIAQEDSTAGRECMSVLNGVEKSELRDMLGKNWLTHDGMWFYHAHQALGADQANTLNRAAIRSLAPIEIRRVQKTLGPGAWKPGTVESLSDFMSHAFELILPHSVFRRFRFGAKSRDVLHWEWEDGECFAFKGMRQAGIIDEYRCGVIYRIECWLEALGMDFNIDPRIDRCIMHTTGTCSGDIRIILGE